MEYLSVKETAQKWGITERRVQFFCSNDKIPGAKNLGKQWLIPISAERPTDGRKKAAKSRPELNRYHFPLFMHSQYFARKDELDEDEKLLYDAQLKYLSSDMPACIVLCRQVLESTFSQSVKFGCYLTIGYASAFLGLYSQYQSSIKMMESIIASEKLHKDDYTLLLESLQAHIVHNVGQTLSCNVSRLSDEALVFFQHMIIINSMVSGKTEELSTVAFFGAYLKNIENEGVLPTSVSVHFMLATLFYRLGDKKRQLLHLEHACKTAIEKGYYSLIAKYSLAENETIDSIIAPYGNEHLQKLHALQKQLILSWVFMNNASVNHSVLKDFTPEQSELLRLVSCNLSLESIAIIKNKPKAEIEKEVSELISKLKLNNLDELVKNARNLFENTNKEMIK